jgi:hypothetical protein
MANNVTAYGRQSVEWPDLGSDPGVTLHGQIVAAVQYLSNNITGRWSGSVAFADGQVVQVEHNFGQSLAQLKVVVAEDGVVIRQHELVNGVLDITEVDTNTLSFENISGVPKTLEIYVYPHHSNIVTADLDPDIDLHTTGKLKFFETMTAAQENDAATGIAQTLSEPSTLHVILNGGGLASVQGIAAPADGLGRVAIFTNSTGGIISFSNDAGTAANRLLTGTGADLQLENNASLLVKYDTSVSKWRVIGSTGGGSAAITVDQVHDFVAGEAIYHDGTAYKRAFANAVSTSEVLGVVSKVIDADTFQFQPAGEVKGLSGLAAGVTYFLSESLSGEITATEPSTIGNVSVPVGVATSATTLLVGIKRGYVIGGANARTQVALTDNATTTVQDISTYDAGELAGFVSIEGTTPLKFYVQCQFSANGAGDDFYVTTQTAGDTPPVGFAVTATAAGLLQIALPAIAGYTGASINYALNAPAVGTNFPLSIDQTAVVPNYRVVTTTGAVSESDYFVSATGATDYTLNLPSAASVAHRIFIIKSRLDATKILTVNPVVGDTIDGEAAVSLFRFESLQLISNGTSWEIF